MGGVDVSDSGELNVESNDAPGLLNVFIVGQFPRINLTAPDASIAKTFHLALSETYQFQIVRISCWLENTYK